MSLKLVHVGAYRTDEGIEVFWSENHCDRDADYLFLLEHWHEFDQPPPISKMDVYVPMEADYDWIMLFVQHNVRIAIRKLEVAAMLTGIIRSLTGEH